MLMAALRIALFLSLCFPWLAAGQSATLMSYNIRYDNPNDGADAWSQRQEDLVALIEYYHPDILGIQEGLHHQVAAIAEQTSHYAWIGVGRDDGRKAGEYTAIFYDTTSWEVLHSETFWLSDRPDTISVGWDAALERICTYGAFQNKDGQTTIHVFNTHFDHVGTEARLESARLMLKQLQEYQVLDAPLVVMGDLNCEPASAPIEQLTSKLTDGATTGETSLYGPLGTFSGFDPARVPDRRIDYIFTRNLSLKSYRHIDDRRPTGRWVSDHLPVWVEVHW